MRWDVQPPRLEFALESCESHQQCSAHASGAARQHGIVDPAAPRSAGIMVVACATVTADPLPARGHVSGSEQRRRRHSHVHASSASADVVQQGTAPQAGAQARHAGAAAGSAAPGSSAGTSGSGGMHRQRLLATSSSWQRQHGSQPIHDRRLASMSARFISITGLQVRIPGQPCLLRDRPEHSARPMGFGGALHSRRLADGCTCQAHLACWYTVVLEC